MSRICEQIKDEFDAWRMRDLSDVAIDYLFVDASHFKMHDGAKSEPVLVAYGITTEGNSVLLHLDGVSAESTDACLAFLEDMVARGLGSPVLTATDGAPGLCAAIDQVFPQDRDLLLGREVLPTLALRHDRTSFGVRNLTSEEAPRPDPAEAEQILCPCLDSPSW